MLFAVAAPFTLLVDMIVQLYGPEQPRTMAGFTPAIALQLLVIPGLIGAIAQLAVAQLVAGPGVTARQALGTAFAVLPAYLSAVLISAFPTGIGFALLLVPGLYLLARLFVIVPVATVERLGPIAMLRRSWDLTTGHGGTLMLFLVLAILFILGASLLTGGVGAALGSLLTLLGLKAVGGFVAALVTAAISTLFSVASATAAAVVYLRLR
ncbi:MAG: hypothetical protein RL490_2168 [Pseudomonadota bacterium]